MSEPDRLKPVPKPFAAVVVGASGGLGAAFVRALAADPACAQVQAWSRRGSAWSDPKVVAERVDTDDEASIAAAFATAGDGAPLRVVVCATGVLHDGATLQPEKALKALDADALMRVYRTNAVGPALVIKHAAERIPRDGRSLIGVLSARVGSISDNRTGGWHAYRASKAALNQIVRTAAIELRRTRPHAVLAALHPGTVDTGLSRPFQRGVEPARLFEADRAAQQLLRVLDGLSEADSGRLFAYDGAEIAP